MIITPIRKYCNSVGRQNRKYCALFRSIFKVRPVAVLQPLGGIAGRHRLPPPPRYSLEEPFIPFSGCEPLLNARGDNCSASPKTSPAKLVIEKGSGRGRRVPPWAPLMIARAFLRHSFHDSISPVFLLGFTASSPLVGMSVF
ncbi:Hypothetical protein NTJ_06993 [Nesidiocoris tenuis]|uniref:Uncharacterized protein n=1 Tax=Nesidiocoris tenuis TaxID=355587 RepID=A0ABN7ASB1_9HEMI|nr:Hypothetical protein NTJ_06993 [Nesidiocoris tenuis]